MPHCHNRLLNSFCFLDFIDAHRYQPPQIRQKLTATEHRSMDLTGLRLVLDRHLSSLSDTIAEHDCYILGKLRYKMSAAYRHHKFWQMARRIGAKLQSIVDTRQLQSLRWIANSIELVDDDTLYAPSLDSFAFAIGQLMQLAIALIRIIDLCRICARESIAQLRHEHLVGFNLILVGTVASVHRACGTHLQAIGRLYDSLSKWYRLIDQKLPTSFASCGHRFVDGLCQLRANSKQRKVHFQFISELLKVDEQTFTLKSNMRQLLQTSSTNVQASEQQLGISVREQEMVVD